MKKDSLQLQAYSPGLQWRIISLSLNWKRSMSLSTLMEFNSGIRVIFFIFHIGSIFGHFQGYGQDWTHLRAISNTGLLVSVNHHSYASANLEVYDVSRKGQAKKIYTFEEVSGSRVSR